MISEPLIKIQTQATATVLSFVTGLLSEDEESLKDIDAKQIMAPYCKQLLQILVALLQKAI